MKRKIIITILTVSCIALTSCNSNKAINNSIDRDSINSNNISTKIALDKVDDSSSNLTKSSYILDKMYKSGNNIVISPMSINMMLGIICNGAVDNTKNDITNYIEADNYNENAKHILDKYYNLNSDSDKEILKESIIKDDKVDFETCRNSMIEAFKSYWNLNNNDATDYSDLYLMGLYEPNFIIELLELPNGFEYYEDKMDDVKKCLENLELVNTIHDLTNILADNTDSDRIYNYITYDYYKDTPQLFNSANLICIDNNYVINDSFIDTIKEYYRANINSIDTNNLNESVNEINNWISSNTCDSIKDTVTKHDIDKENGAILINTTYLKSDWVSEWSPCTLEFTDFNNKKKTITAIENNYINQYFENDEAVAFATYYKNRMKFIGILPKSEGEFNISVINLEDLLHNNQNYDFSKINVKMPKIEFDIENKNIADALKELGLKEIFSDDNHIENIINNKLKINSIIQRCRIDLGESSNSIESSYEYDSDDKSTTIILNRPFIFLIIDEDTNEVIYLGKVVTVD